MSLAQKKIKNKPKLLSLFCGAGGLDIGFDRQGFETKLAFDIRPDSIQSYNFNRDAQAGHVRDVRDLTLADLDELNGEMFKPVGVIGGPPCQGFSISNVNKKKLDKRNTLSYVYADLLKKLNKRNPVHFFVFENVKGLLGERHKNSYKKIKSLFKKAGFDVYLSILDAANFGIPQNRERLLIIGLNSEIYADLDWHFPIGLDNYSKTPKTVRQTIEGLPEPAYFSNVKRQEDIGFHPNHWCMTPKSSKFTKGLLTEGTSFGRSFRTLYWDKPSPTVAYGNREVHVHPTGKRRLSIYEAMLLQGFPEDYRLIGNLSQQITQVSEAVPPPLAEVLAKSIVKRLRL